MRESRTAPGSPEAPPLGVEFDWAGWLASGILLLAGPGHASGQLVAKIRRGDTEKAVELHQLDYALPAYPGAPGALRTLLMLFLPPGYRFKRDDTLVINGDESNGTFQWHELKALLTDRRTLSRELLAPLDPETRSEAMAFLARALGVPGHRNTMDVAQNLFQLRAGLRERYPLYIHANDSPRGLAFELIMAVDDRSFYLAGWACDQEAEIVSLTAVAPEGHSVELASEAFCFPRPDVATYFSRGIRSRQDPTAKVGFTAFVTLDSPSLLDEGWVLEMESAEGVVLETAGPTVIRDPKFVRERILADTGRFRLPDQELMVNHVMPAMTRIQEHIKASIRIVSVEQFGDAPADPTISIVIPLYKRVDLIEQQLAEFVQDEEMSQVDLIYVLDSPEQEDELLFLAARLFPIYRVPMRVAILERNVGFSGANNAGASIARGRLLTLMNSDVLPDKPGWLGSLQRFYDATPNIGALAPKVLYEDGSIQNAGMRFHRPMGTSVWLDAHFYRGLHRDFAPANVPRRVPLVSGCCFMIDRSLYESLGGLQGIYVQGDYEDTDLCMRLNELGRDNWYLPEAEVYHPEGLSYTSDTRRAANRYNGWLHTHIWQDRIESVMARYEASNGTISNRKETS